MKRFLACITMLLVAVAFMPTMTFAASKTVKMTGYDNVLKQGSTVYVAGAGTSIYKVKVKKGVVKSKKRITKDNWVMGAYSYTSGMKKKGKYLYIQEGTEGTLFYLSRVNLSSGKTKILASSGDENGPVKYVIKGKKIYYKLTWSGKKRVMKLNGKSKKKTSAKIVMKTKKSNAKGYSVSYKEKGGKVITYLKTPKGKYKLGAIKIY